ncbi:MAG: sigma-54-dependent Fis family transcriptional regulator, partial [Phycisphaerae bacterium]|nr:sigma-54-dependent Fis family transcriptional regulator [Phycisphaerae bacterium]
MGNPKPPELTSPRLDVLVVDDEINVRKTLVIGLEAEGHRVAAVSNARDAIDEAGRRSFDLAFVDLKLGATSGIDLIPELLSQNPWTRVVIITAHGSIDSAVETMRRGAADYLTKPFTPAQVRLTVERVARLRALEQQVAGLQQRANDVMISSASGSMQQALQLAHSAASTDTTILLHGESGTGKGVMARSIHEWSPRAAKPFATVSCPALSATLLESELFGHAKGAFTGAVRDNPGRITSSDGGTLFLDEIGDLPLGLQPKLLRFLQDREFERVGESRTRRADVRIIAATNIDLERSVDEGRFRADLLYRINVVQVTLPPLRERAEDLAELCNRFLAEFAKKKHIAGFTDEAKSALAAYAWPGNIRELRNVVERAVILCRSDQIALSDLPANLGRSRTT